MTNRSDETTLLLWLRATETACHSKGPQKAPLNFLVTNILDHGAVVPVCTVVRVCVREALPWMILVFGDDAGQHLNGSGHPNTPSKPMKPVCFASVTDDQLATRLEHDVYLFETISIVLIFTEVE
jgi:hypothetical protein